MTHLVWLLAFALASPAGAADKAEKKDDKKKAPEKAAAASADDLVKQADAKIAAGDAAGAKELLQQAAALPTATGDVSLRLGRVLESTHELDGAMDAYKAAG